MTKLIVILTLIVSSESIAADSWLCTEASSQRHGDSILACGIGNGKDENTARLTGFDNSKIEFDRICKSSDDCRNHNITVQPERTSCEKENGTYKCYRLIVFTIGPVAETTGNYSSKNLKTNDSPDKFEPFVYEKTLQYPKVKRGMAKKDLLAQFGVPVSTVDIHFPDWSDGLDFRYKGKMCVDDYVCHVKVRKDEVHDWSDIKPIYSGDLE